LHVIQAAASARGFDINQYTATGSVTPTYSQLATLASMAMGSSLANCNRGVITPGSPTA
jgi:hypothetical protein